MQHNQHKMLDHTTPLKEVFDSFYSHLFTLKEKIKDRQPSKIIEDIEKISIYTQEDNKKYLEQCIDASLNIVRLMEEYFKPSDESMFHKKKKFRNAQLQYTLSQEFKKFGNDGKLNIIDAGTTELAKILLEHLDCLNQNECITNCRNAL